VQAAVVEPRIPCLQAWGVSNPSNSAAPTDAGTVHKFLVYQTGYHP